MFLTSFHRKPQNRSHRRVSFLPVGHTKFAPDAHFGQFKAAWTKSSCHTLKELCALAARIKNTTVVLVGDEKGDAFVNQYDWNKYFEQQNLKTVPAISKYQHFSTSIEHLGIIRYSEAIAEPDQSNVLSTVIYPDDWENRYPTFPDVVQPEGLPIERKTYLYKKIRPYVRSECKNVLCPKP